MNDKMVATPPKLAQEIAAYYMTHPESLDVPCSTWHKQIQKDWCQLWCLVNWSENDPYKTLQELKNDIRLGSFTVYTGELQTKYMGSLMACWGRAIHDWDHYLLDAEFDFDGECQVAYSALRRWPASLRDVIVSEIVGQAAVKVVTGKFPKQKIVRGIWRLMP